MKKRILSAVLCLAMLLSLFPVTASAWQYDETVKSMSDYLDASCYDSGTKTWKLNKNIVLTGKTLLLAESMTIDLNGYNILHEVDYYNRNWNDASVVIDREEGAPEVSVRFIDSSAEKKQVTLYLDEDEAFCTPSDVKTEDYTHVLTMPSGSILLNTENVVFAIASGTSLELDNVGLYGDEYAKHIVTGADGSVYEVAGGSNRYARPVAYGSTPGACFLDLNPMCVFVNQGKLTLNHVIYDDAMPDFNAGVKTLQYTGFLNNTGSTVISNSTLNLCLTNSLSDEPINERASRYAVTNGGNLTLNNTETTGIRIMNGQKGYEINAEAVLNLNDVQMYAGHYDLIALPAVYNYAIVNASGNTRLHDAMNLVFASVVMENGSKLNADLAVRTDDYTNTPSISVQIPNERLSRVYKQPAAFCATVTGRYVGTSFPVRLINQINSRAQVSKERPDYVIENGELRYASVTDLNDITAAVEDILLDADSASGLIDLKIEGFKQADLGQLSDIARIVNSFIQNGFGFDEIQDSYLKQSLESHTFGLLERLGTDKTMAERQYDPNYATILGQDYDSLEELIKEALYALMGKLGYQLPLLSELLPEFPYTNLKNPGDYTLATGCDFTGTMDCAVQDAALNKGYGGSYQILWYPNSYYGYSPEDCQVDAFAEENNTLTNPYVISKLIVEGKLNFKRQVLAPRVLSAGTLRDNLYLQTVEEINRDLEEYSSDRERYASNVSSLSDYYYIASQTDGENWMLIHDTGYEFTRKTWNEKIGLEKAEIDALVAAFNKATDTDFPSTCSDLYLDPVYRPSEDPAVMAQCRAIIKAVEGDMDSLWAAVKEVFFSEDSCILNMTSSDDTDTFELLNCIKLIVDCSDPENSTVSLKLEASDVLDKALVGILGELYDELLMNSTVQKYLNNYIDTSLKPKLEELKKGGNATELLELIPEDYRLPASYDDFCKLADKAADVYFAENTKLGELFEQYGEGASVYELLSGKKSLTAAFFNMLDELPKLPQLPTLSKPTGRKVGFIEALRSFCDTQIERYNSFAENAEGQSTLALLQKWGGIARVTDVTAQNEHIVAGTPVQSFNELLQSYGVFDLTKNNSLLGNKLEKTLKSMTEKGYLCYRFTELTHFGSLIVLPTEKTVLTNVEILEKTTENGVRLSTAAFAGDKAMEKILGAEVTVKYAPEGSDDWKTAEYDTTAGQYLAETVERTTEDQKFRFQVIVEYNDETYTSGIGSYVIPATKITQGLNFTLGEAEFRKKYAEELADGRLVYSTETSLSLKAYEQAQVIYLATVTELQGVSYLANTLILKDATIEPAEKYDYRCKWIKISPAIVLPTGAALVLNGRNTVSNEFGSGIFTPGRLSVIADVKGAALSMNVNDSKNENRNSGVYGIYALEGDLLIGTGTNLASGKPVLDVNVSSAESANVGLYSEMADMVIYNGDIKVKTESTGSNECRTVGVEAAKNITVMGTTEMTVDTSAAKAASVNALLAYGSSSVLTIADSAVVTAVNGNTDADSIRAEAGTKLYLDEIAADTVKSVIIYNDATETDMGTISRNYLVINNAELDPDTAKLTAGTFSFKPAVNKMAARKILTAEYQDGRTLYTISENIVEDAPQVVEKAAEATVSDLLAAAGATVTDVAKAAASEASHTNIEGAGIVNASAKIAEQNEIKTGDQSFVNEKGETVRKSIVAAVNEKIGGSKTADELAIVIQTFAEVEVVDLQLAQGTDKAASITYDIQPWMQKVVTTKEAVENEEVNDENSVKLGEPEKLEITEPVVLTLPLPAAFGEGLSVGDTLYVTHEKEDDAAYVYTAEVVAGADNGLAVSFENPHGFSEFTVSTENPAAASVGSISYLTLQEAFAAVQDGETVSLLKDYDGGETFSLGREVSFIFNRYKFTFNGKIEAGVGYHNESSKSHEYDIVKNPVSTPVYYGSTKKTITVNAATYGSVAAGSKSAESGEVVTLTVLPKEGYVLKSLKVLDSAKNELSLTKVDASTYTFVMPNTAVTVKAEFGKNAMKFVDVLEGKYYYDAIAWAVEKGITTGRDETHFVPMAPTKRCETITFLWRAAGCPEPKTATTAFVDLEAGSYYEKAVLWGVENGIVKGTSLTTFSPEETITRAQMVTFLARMQGVKDEASGYTHGFSDVTANDYFNNAVAWAAEQKITEGISETLFAPNNDCIRGQLVTFLYRCFAD